MQVELDHPVPNLSKSKADSITGMPVVNGVQELYTYSQLFKSWFGRLDWHQISANVLYT